ncbi:MAG: hypothetical protein IPK81_21580 [Rhodospirillales bacterium]|nr:MAG: hypothetical protein IPK81_21580 [Rhodospirillales bacterium]
MPVRTSAVGETLVHECEVPTRWALAYAAVTGFTQDQCFDDTRAGGVVLPPTFCVAPEWAIGGGDARTAALGLSWDERRRGVHVLQDSLFHAPIRAGMRLRCEGTVVQIRATSAGSYVLTRYDTREIETGDLLATSFSGGMIRGIAPDGPDRGDTPAELLPEPRPAPADGARATALALDKGLPHVYSECAQIWNPIHSERRVALAAGLPDVIIHGTITWTLTGREAVRLHAGGDVTKLKRLSGRFRAPVPAGVGIVVRDAARDDEAGLVDLEVATAGGAVALSHGLAVFA